MASTFLAATHIYLQVASTLAVPRSSTASAASALHIPRATKSSVSAPPDEPWRNLDLVLITGIILGARGDRYRLKLGNSSIDTKNVLGGQKEVLTSLSPLLLPLRRPSQLGLCSSAGSQLA